MEKNNQTFDIFLSYRRDGGMKDAMLLLNALERRGYSVFLDMNSLRENRFDDQIFQRIDECKDFLLILPPNALDRCNDKDDWVRQEIEHAHSGGKNIVPIMLEGFEFPEKLPKSIDFVRYLNGIRPSFDFFDAFIDKLTCFLKSEPTTIETPEKSDPPRRPRYMIYIVIGVLVVVAGIVGRLIIKPEPDPGPGTGGTNQTEVQSEPATESEETGQNDGTTVFRPGEDNVLMGAFAGINLSRMNDQSLIDARESQVFDMPYRREQIVAVRFFDSTDNAPSDARDISAAGTNDVLAWVQKEGADRYSLSIAGEGGVSAPASCNQLFAGYTNLTEIQFNDVFYMDKVTDVSGMFMFCTNLKEISGLHFKTADVKDFSFMFYHCENLKSIALQDFNTQNAESFACMFEQCLALKELDFSKFKTEHVSDFSWMFAYCKFNKLDLKSFKTSEARTMKAMFVKCADLTEIAGLGQFDTGKVEDMSYMFYDCNMLDTSGISGFNTESVKKYDHFMSDDAEMDWESMFMK